MFLALSRILDIPSVFPQWIDLKLAEVDSNGALLSFLF